MDSLRLPAWLDAAICTMGVEPLRRPLVSRWREIEIDVLPALAELSDIGKRLVFEQAFAATLSDFPTIRQVQKDLRALHKKIADCAMELANLLQQVTEVSALYDMCTGVPDLWSSLDSVAQQWPTWYAVMESHGYLQDFLRVAKGQSRPGPAWSDLLEGLATGMNDDDVESHLDPVIKSRKQSADAVRAIQHFMRLLIHPDIPPHFVLKDQAIASLVNVLFNMEVDAMAVKQLRYRDCR